MKRPFLLTTLILWFIAKGVFGQAILLKDVRIVDPHARQITRGHLILAGGEIKQVVKQAPENFSGQVLDLSGKWVIPGLNDMHTHSFGNFGPGRITQFLTPAGTAKVMLYCGVTGFLDLFNGEDYILSLRRQQRTVGLPGADIYCAGPCFTCTGGHCTEYGMPTRVINSPEDAIREVTDLATKKPDVIKLIYDHAYTRMPTVGKQTMKALVETANKLNIKTVIHIGTWQDAEEAALAGATSLTHTHGDVIPDRLLKLLKEKNVYMIPTLTVHTGLLEIMEEQEFLKKDLLAEVTTPDLLSSYSDTSSFQAQTKGWLRSQRGTRDVILSNIKKISQNGIKIMAGTDSGNLGTFQGYSVHTEMAFLVEAGLSNWEALAAATTVPGDFWGKAFGVRPGDEANLVILDASPIEDIRNTEKISMVIHHGKIIDRESLIATQ